MILEDWAHVITPLTWYQQIMFHKTIKVFEESERVIADILLDLNMKFNERDTLYENIRKSGSIGYNYIIDNTPLSRTGFSLGNHGIEENFALIVTEGSVITSISNYYSNGKCKIDQVIRKLPSSNTTNFYVTSICKCDQHPSSFFKTKHVFCNTCFRNWRPLDNAFYPELLQPHREANVDLYHTIF